jgi:2-methylcitrate dehydratase PrpD
VIEPLREISAPTRRLSAYMADAPHRALPAAVVEKARQHILDTLAAMISGARLRPGRLAIDYVAKLGGARQASVVGTRLLTCPVHAALANGMLAHADETDDSHAPSRNHPGCAVVPAALAVAESTHASGEQLMRAVVLGYDVAARVNYALDADAFAATSRSTHSVGGTFGAGAAAARCSTSMIGERDICCRSARSRRPASVPMSAIRSTSKRRSTLAACRHATASPQQPWSPPA